ncbi:MAG: amidohydrolase family protein [Phycisphaerae bacterium]|nr:amidohydrolase family protein [Phycisphaerae bacterium]
MRIDAHHHFWRYNAAEYGWISDAMSVLRRDFLPEHLAAEIRTAGVDGVVSVQARQTVQETAWLLELAEEHDFIRGVVGWVPLVSPTVADDLARLAANRKLKAVRHVLQGEADDDYMLRPDFNAGIAALKPFDLAYDILIFERHLPATLKLVDRHPNQVFVVDHIAKPRIRDSALQPWRDRITDLARRANVYCKLSGMVTEADWQRWTPQQLRPYAEVVLEAFGPRRVMFGSDWPVCLLATTYQRWTETVEGFIAALSPAEQDRIWSATAIEAYRL